MKNKFLLLYSWFVMLILSWLPDQPLIMRFRGWMLSFAMKKCGKDFQVSSSVIIRGLQRLEVGNHVYLAPRVTLNAVDTIVICDEVMVAFNSIVVSGNHTSINGSFRFGESEKCPVSIGEGSWIAANVTVLAGATIGSGVVVAANSSVKGQLEDHCLYAGVPAMKIKEFKL